MQKGIVKGEELKSKHAKMTSIWRIRPEHGVKDHPAPFPIAIPTRCIFSIADETKGLNILDPYCGSGTTLLSAACLGHNFVGIDSCAEYAALAEKRLYDPMEILAVADETALHLVEQTYAERKSKKLKKV
jgi:modification methylase